MPFKFKNIGPGAIVAAAFIGPGTITTATLAGASYGFTLLWAILFSVVATYVLQEMSARLGLIAGLGVGEAIRSKIQNRILKIASSALIVAAILIGNAAYEAGNITGAVIGFSNNPIQLGSFSFNPFVLLIGTIAFLLLFSGKYKLIEKSLIAMVTVMGVVFILTAILLKPNFIGLLNGLFVPHLPQGALIMVLGLIGTTVVPYNLFLHAAAVKKKWSGAEHLSSSKWDTVISVVIGGLITLCILICSAIAFGGRPAGINTVTDLSLQLQPILGRWSGTFMTLGFFAAGLSSSVTAPLAAAFVASEIFNWEDNLKGRNFRITWAAVLLVGILFASLGLKPTAIILFSQVANGLLLPIIAVFLLWIMNDSKILGVYTNSRTTNLIAMAVIIITLILGMKGILSASNML